MVLSCKTDWLKHIYSFSDDPPKLFAALLLLIYFIL